MSNQSNFIKIEDMTENKDLAREESMSVLPQPELGTSTFQADKPSKVSFYHNHIVDDDDDDLTPHAYDFSEPNKIDFHVKSQTPSISHSRRHTPPTISRDGITPSASVLS